MYSKPSRNLMQLLLLATLATSGCMASESSDKTLPKRSLGDSSIPWASTSSAQLGAGVAWNAGGGGGAGGWSSGGWSGGHSPLKTAPSPNEVANAISAAKQASANVLIAQQQMQAAKENVLNQQRIAMEKETHAAILTQKSEAAAASALQRSAHAAAAEIQKSEYEASKFGQFTRNGNAGAAHHLTIIKDTALSPITAGTNHVTNLESLGLGPWLSGNSVGKASAASSWL
ncbi:uncharacterized protein LOC127565687 [Drosophila albomicans]|uniref:Uncharacterized protein LOC127565687 n=1 Tax=Drosophila albomicans TaxID=7291 RepID=A0A9C6WFZ7_DROAB|nr:uncharacterized protein LOC127565687 [Drosophila albomicans]